MRAQDAPPTVPLSGIDIIHIRLPRECPAHEAPAEFDPENEAERDQSQSDVHVRVIELEHANIRQNPQPRAHNGKHQHHAHRANTARR